jgi:hypothetical protein
MKAKYPKPARKKILRDRTNDYPNFNNLIRLLISKSTLRK